jgi:hypothetical protein
MTTHGGKREGSGRRPVDPALKKMPIFLKLPQWMLDWMATREENRAELIEQALMKVHKLTPPMVHTTTPKSD